MTIFCEGELDTPCTRLIPVVRFYCLYRRWKKIFSSKTHGGKRDYAVALAVDVSQSVGDHTAQCTVASVVMMLAALEEIGVETVSIITFGAKITCVKTEDQPMDSVVVAALLSALRFDEPRTRDAEAIECVAGVACSSILQRFNIVKPRACAGTQPTCYLPQM